MQQISPKRRTIPITLWRSGMSQKNGDSQLHRLDNLRIYVVFVYGDISAEMGKRPSRIKLPLKLKRVCSFETSKSDCPLTELTS
jgi:hypothetical protein